MAKKIRKSQILRHFIQIILFILLPGLYAMTFSELKIVYQMIVGGNFNFIQAFPNLVEFVAVMGLTIIVGRWFCGWLCAFGAYNDLIYAISRKVFKVKFRVDEKVDSILKYVKYVVLVFIIIISWTMGSSILESVSPWDAFGQITDLSTIFSSLLIGFILLVLITIGAFFIERFFCRYLCPLGAVFAITSRIGITKINKPKADCGKCRACTMNCSMGLQLYKVNGARGGECINCLKCTEVCPRNNANANILGQDLNQNLAGSVAMATMLGVYGLTNLGADAISKSGIISKDSAISNNVTSDNTSQNYKDGTYTGIGIGFKGRTTKVSVTIADGKITTIETLSTGDDDKYYERASESVINGIISKQATSVDTVSGATYSSKGIISAVKDALNQAVNSSTSSNTTNNDSQTKEAAVTSNSTENSKSTTSDAKVNEASTSTNKSTTNDASNNSSTKSNTSASTSTSTSTTNQGSTSSNSTSAYKDGTYTGSGRGFKGGTTKVSVTVTNGKIASIETLSNGDTPKYYDRVEGTMTNRIISKQSTSVDTVSGATYSSKGIMSAVENALSQAK